jgi:hypothetical protein
VAPALIILGLWVVVLAPGVVRWARVRQPTTSIASFHRQLRLLEHTGPKIVEPAYRLGGVDEPVVERVAPSPPVKQPRLVLLPSAATTKESTMRYDDRYDQGYDERPDPRYDDRYDTRHDPRYDGRPGSRDDEWVHDPWGAGTLHDDEARYTSSRTARVPAYDYGYDDHEYDHDAVQGLSPDHAKSRRKAIILGLGAAVVGSFLLGIVTGSSMLFLVTVMSILALGCYLGLMLYAARAGFFGQSGSGSVTSVARVVVPGTFQQHDQYRDEDDGWQDQVAAAR